VLPPRARDVLRERVPVLREADAPRLLPSPEPEPPAELREPLDRLAPEPADLARDELDFVLPAPLLALVERDFVPADAERDFVPDDAPAERLLLERAPDAREVEDERPLLPRDELPDEDEEEPPLDPSSAVHLPDMTRCAASATASAISEPSLVALDMTLLAA
jgi:hypothetical protein